MTSRFAIPLVLIIDAMPVFAEVAATLIKNPADKSLWCHVQFLCDLLDRLVMHVLIRFDNRDMCDGLTKGTADRVAIQEVTGGTISVGRDA